MTFAEFFGLDYSADHRVIFLYFLAINSTYTLLILSALKDIVQHSYLSTLRSARRLLASDAFYKPVTIIVPAYNEAAVIPYGVGRVSLADEGSYFVGQNATIGTQQAVIADIIGIDAKTLRKHYREELDQSVAQANAVIGGALFNKAKAGAVAKAPSAKKRRNRLGMRNATMNASV